MSTTETNSTDLPIRSLVIELLGNSEVAPGINEGPVRIALADLATLLAADPAFDVALSQHIGFASKPLMDADLDWAEGTIAEVPNDVVVAATTTRSRASNIATIGVASTTGLTVGMFINVRGLGGSGYNAVNKTISAVNAGVSFSYASVGGNESSTPDTSGSVDRNGEFVKIGAVGTGSWVWVADLSLDNAVAQALAALSAAAAANELAAAADERGLQANPRRGIAKPFLYGEKTADGYIQEFVTYDGRKDESLFLVKHRRSAHPTLVARDTTADGKLLSTLDYKGDLVDYFQRRYIDDFLESERFGWFGVLSVGTILVASGFPYELSVVLTWPSDGADISMTMSENDQLINWVDAI
jgi:hypothetical protein